MEGALKRSKGVVRFIRENPVILLGAICLMIVSKLPFALYLIGLIVNLAFIKYIQMRFRGETAPNDVLKNTIKDKFLDVLIITVKVMLVMMPALIALNAETSSIINRYVSEGTINYLSVFLLVPTLALITLLMNRLSIHKEMAVLGNFKGSTSIERAFNITKGISKELLPVTLMEVLFIIIGMFLLNLQRGNLITYEKMAIFQGINLVFNIFWTAFVSCYRVSIFMSLEERVITKNDKVRKMR